MTDQEIGRRIRYLREKKNYTREQFAELADISPKFLYEIENGNKGFSAKVLIRISQALGVSCEYIMTGDDKRSKLLEQIDHSLNDLDFHQMGQVKDILTVIHEMCK